MATKNSMKCYHQSMNLHVRDVPDAVHRRLARRASAEGVSLRSYVVKILTEAAEFPTVDEWLDELEKAPPTRLRSSGAGAVRRSRASDDASIDRGHPRR
jgi:hypothetical protein